MNDENSFLGRGWSFPPSFDNNSGEVIMLDGEDDIQSSLRILLSTTIGERVMQPTYGCNLGDMIFETLDTTLETEMKRRIEVGILYFESRIDLIDVEMIPQNDVDGLILISIDYSIRTTNSRGNLVYPFYLNEV